MSNKVLKKYTTIPPHLYVERSADKQLKQIIEDMQRPGYVLVARQMGKTNLLFNAKRNLESDDRKFVYIDLSNNFETERECYEFIIDTITNLLNIDDKGFFDNLAAISARTITDHVFYTKSLLQILRYINGNLVLILDEIDALRTSEFSDNIFAVIRSNYFTRSNFPEFERLTYILSGVIEPKDLIKDRNKSPFNIGEKIYLDDFSYGEFNSFLTKSQLDLPECTRAHIYTWTNGNPRLTFDVCSEIESMVLNGISIDDSCIDRMIKSKYLTSYDIAPIDHIRELVSDDKSIQDAVVNLQLAEAQENTEQRYLPLTDKIKRKLYLYGIVSLKNEDGEVKIKNRIIKEALSMNWVKSLQEDYGLVLQRAIALIEDSCDYLKGREFLAPIVEGMREEKSGNEFSLALYYLGFAEHMLNNFEESNTLLLEKPVASNVSPLLHYRARLFVGLNFYNLNDIVSGNESLLYIIENYKNNLTWLTAAIRYAQFNKESECAKAILKRIIELPHDTALEAEGESRDELEKTLLEVKSFAYFLLAETIDEVDFKISHIESALDLNVPEQRPYLYFSRAILLDNIDEQVCQEIVEFIIEKELSVFNKGNEKYSIDFGFSMLCNIAYFCFLYGQRSFVELYNYSVESMGVNPEGIIRGVLSLMQSEKDKVDLLQFYFKNESVNIPIELYREYTINLFAIDSERLDQHSKAYIEYIVRSNKLVRVDIPPLSQLIRESIETENVDFVVPLLNNFNDLLDTLDTEDTNDASVLVYWAFEFYRKIGDFRTSSEFGKKALLFLESTNTSRTIISEEGEKIIKERILRSFVEDEVAFRSSPIRRKYKFGRNDKVKVRYNDGTIKVDKFKRLKEHIDLGLCEISD